MLICVCLSAHTHTQHTSSCCLDQSEPTFSRDEIISSTSSLEKHLREAVTYMVMQPSYDCHVIATSNFLLLVDSVQLVSKCEILRINIVTLVREFSNTVKWTSYCNTHCMMYTHTHARAHSNTVNQPVCESHLRSP